MRLVLLGPPGVGKGTLANALKEKLDIDHISTGDILREEMKNNTPLGQEVKKYVESGELVPDEVVTRLIENRLSGSNDNGGYLFDGFPRTKTQAEDLDKLLNRINKPIDFAVYLDSSLPVLVVRLTGRRVCRNCGGLYHAVNKPPQRQGVCDECGGELYQRPDDNEETIKNRMDVYLKNTLPIIDYYKSQGKIKTLDASKSTEEVQAMLMQIIDEDRAIN